MQAVTPRHDACSKYFVVTALGDGRLIYKVSVLPFVTSQAFRTLGTNNGDQRVADSRVCRRTQRMLRVQYNNGHNQNVKSDNLKVYNQK